MTKALKRAVVTAVSFVLLFLWVGFVGVSCDNKSKGYVLPEYSSEKTQAEHLLEINKRAEQMLCEKYEHGISLTYTYVAETVYNFKDQPQFFAVWFSYGKGVVGAVIDDEYYIMESNNADTVDGFWKGLGDTNVKKYYDGYKYSLIDGKVINLNGNLVLDENELKEKKEQPEEIHLSNNNRVCESLEEAVKFCRKNQDAYYLYVLPDYATNLTEEQHKQNILSRAENKFNVLYEEEDYLSVKAELMPSLDGKQMYFMVTFTPSDIIFYGETKPYIYQTGIIINDEYYWLCDISGKDNVVYFKENSVEDAQKYYSNYCDFDQWDYKYGGQYFVKEGEDFYLIRSDGKIKDNKDYRERYYSVKVKDVYNPTVTDAFTVYRT